MELSHLVVGARWCFYSLTALAKADVDEILLGFLLMLLNILGAVIKIFETDKWHGGTNLWGA